jgi:hypothetical protein
MGAGVVSPQSVAGVAVAGSTVTGLTVGSPDPGGVTPIQLSDSTLAGVGDVSGNVGAIQLSDSTLAGTGARVPTGTGAITLSDATVSGTGAVTDGPTVTRIVMPSSVDEVAANDEGAAFQGTGGHTLYGSAIYFDADLYLWTSVNGVGADPEIAGDTGHEVALSGTAPFSADAWATAAQSVLEGLGYTVSRTGGQIDVSGNGIDSEAAETAQGAVVAFSARGAATVLGSTQQDAGGSTSGASTGWVQVLPADVPNGTFRVIGFGIRRGSNVASGVRMSLAADGTSSDGDPEGSVVVAGRTVGDSGAGNWHYEYFSASEVVEFAGSNRLFIATHGDGASSSLYAGSTVDDGLYAGGGAVNLWLTDGTTGSTTPAVSPVGAVTSQFNFGLSVRLIIQEAPYQTDGGYRVIGGAVPGQHDGTLFTNGTTVNNIFVGWRIVPPSIDGLSLMDTQARLNAHAAGDSSQIRFEFWSAAGGGSTMAGDTITSLIGVTSDTQGTGWSSVQTVAPISVTGGSEYRYTIKGSPDTGQANDVRLDFWLGSAGADDIDDAGHPHAYAPSATNLAATELEVFASPPSGTAETGIDFDPQTATASPNPSNGTVFTPNNLSMIALYFGKAAPTVTAV